MNKWDAFRERREIAQKDYLRAKRKQRAAERLLKYFSRQICVAQIAETLWAEKRLRAYKRYSFLIAMRLAVKFRFINNCKYRGLSKKLTGRTRSSIAYAGSAWSHTYAQRAKATVGAFFAQMVRTWNLNDLVYKLDDLVRFM